jgi:hypothetical protein
MAQLLYDMGMEINTEEITPATKPHTPQIASYPPMPSNTSPMHQFKKPINTPIPLRLTEAPTHNEIRARAAKMECPTKGFGIIEEMQLDKEEVFAQIYLSPSPYFEAFEEEIDIRQWSSTNDHRTAGLSIIKNQDRLILASILRSTPAARIDKWRSRCHGAWIMEVNGAPVNDIDDVASILHQCKTQGYKSVKILLSHPEIKSGLTSKGIPQVHIDQLNPKFILNLEHIAKQRAPVIESAGVFQYSFNKLTSGKLVKQDDWCDWQASEWKQLDQYYEQLMFGKPTFVKDRSQVFHLVWTYMVKDVDKRKKARCACDGSTRGGKVRVLDYTHANCVDHTASRIFYGIAAAENHMIYGADVCNAFSEAPPPKQGFYIQPDRAFNEWWAARGREPIPEGYVIPVMPAMQGHPESSRLWEKHCDKIVKKLGFKPTVHEPCLYDGIIDGERCIFKRQVDDFALATVLPEIAHKFFDLFDNELTMPMKRMGLITLFNGVDILQSRYYIKMSCETYSEKMSTKHLSEWMTESTTHSDSRNVPQEFQHYPMRSRQKGTGTIG